MPGQDDWVGAAPFRAIGVSLRTANNGERFCCWILYGDVRPLDTLGRLREEWRLEAAGTMNHRPVPSWEANGRVNLGMCGTRGGLTYSKPAIHDAIERGSFDE